MAYSAMIPAWEANDEMAHTANIQYWIIQGDAPPIQMESRFPIPRPPYARKIRWHETHQPPLYYILGALWQQALGIPAFKPAPLPFSEGWHIDAFQLVFSHNYDINQRIQARQLHQLRWLSTALGLCTVLLVYAAGRLAVGRPEVALGSAGFVAFLPKFNVISAVVSNDILVVMLSTLGLVLALAYLRHTATRHRFGRLVAFLMGVAAGAAALAKLNYLPLAPVLFLSIFLTRTRPPRRLVDAILALTGFALVAAWWFLRNLHEHGDLFAETDAAAWLKLSMPSLIEPVPWTDAPRFLYFVPKTFLRSTWYNGGWNQFAAPTIANLMLALLAAVSIVAGIVTFGRGKMATGITLDWRVGLLLSASALGGLAAVLIIAKNTTQAEGRIAYVGIGGFALLTVTGLVDLLVRLSGERLPAAGAALVWPLILLAFNFYVMGCFIIPFRGL
jgi:4-amino-4-deoxy-L-arabinose transferase-like glycosyltransferase